MLLKICSSHDSLRFVAAHNHQQLPVGTCECIVAVSQCTGVIPLFDMITGGLALDPDTLNSAIGFMVSLYINAAARYSAGYVQMSYW